MKSEKLEVAREAEMFFATPDARMRMGISSRPSWPPKSSRPRPGGPERHAIVTFYYKNFFGIRMSPWPSSMSEISVLSGWQTVAFASEPQEDRAKTHQVLPQTSILTLNCGEVEATDRPAQGATPLESLSHR